jgi:hypothetical protein
LRSRCRAAEEGAEEHAPPGKEQRRHAVGEGTEDTAPPGMEQIKSRRRGLTGVAAPDRTCGRAGRAEAPSGAA